MNDFAVPLFWSVVQVTGVSLVGFLLAVFLARRGAGTVAPVAALAACCAPTLLAFVPTPTWWRWQPAVEPAAATATPDTDTARSHEDSSGKPGEPPASGLELSSVSRHLRSVLSVPVSSAAGRRVGWIAVAFLLGIGLSLCRLGFGLWSVRRFLRRCRPITDVALLDLVRELCAELGITRSVDLHESDELNSAATVGWRRAVVVLPVDWPSWDADERRAVLAHELAHVGHGDFRTRVLARVARALHFYHPLVRLLVRRLDLHQELAADARAAQTEAELGAYLRALARLALRADERAPHWAAPAFLSSPGTLLRRVAMLQARDGLRTPSRRGRAAIISVLALVALAASAVRGPAQKPEPISDAPSGDKVTKERPPFDLTYVPPDGHGVLAVRPAAFFARPDARELREPVHREIKDVLSQLKLLGPDVKADEWDLRIEDIEQVVMTVRFFAMKNSKPDQGQTGMTLDRPLIRTTRDYDWSGRLRKLLPTLKEITIEGRTCLTGVKELAPMLGRGDLCFCILDKRTLLVDSEAGIRAALKSAKEKRALPAWHDDWKAVERALFVQCITDIRPILAERRATPDTAEPEVALLKTCETLVFSFDLDTDARWSFHGRSRTEKEAGEMRQALAALLKACAATLKPKPAKDDPLAAGRRVLSDLLTTGEVVQSGTRVHGGAVSKNVDVAALLAVLRLADETMP